MLKKSCKTLGYNQKVPKQRFYKIIRLTGMRSVEQGTGELGMQLRTQDLISTVLFLSSSDQ